MYFPQEAQKLDSPHLATAKSLFPPSDGLILTKEFRYVFICFSNRCGSNFLSELLASGRRINLAGEFFNSNTMKDVSKSEGITNISDYLKFVTIQESINNVIIIKIALTHLIILHEFNLLPYLVEKAAFLFIFREDLLGQAISMLIADQTKAWTFEQKPTLSDRQLQMSLPRIAMTLDNFAYQNYLWAKFLAHNALQSMQLSYEALLRFPGPISSEIEKWLDLDLCIDPKNVSIKPQRRAINAKWRAAYLANI